jgi:hypothetical protein
MANQHKHRARQIRDIPEDDWEDFGVAAEEDGTTRSRLVAAFVKAYLGHEGARMPRRPKRD